MGFTTFGDIDVSFSVDTMGKVLGVPSSSYGVVHTSGHWPKNKTQVVQRVLGKASASPYSTNELGYIGWIAHQFLIKVVVPRLEKRTTITINDMLLLDKLLNMEKISLPKIMMRHMAKSAGKNHGLSYPSLSI